MRYLQTEDNAEGLGDDPHGFLPTLDELAAARPAGRRRARSELRVRINFAGFENYRRVPSSLSLTSLGIRLVVTQHKLHVPFIHNSREVHVPRHSVRLHTGDVRPAVSLQYNRPPWRLISFIQFEYQIGCTVTEGSIDIAVGFEGSEEGRPLGDVARTALTAGGRARSRARARYGRYGGGCGRSFLSSRESAVAATSLSVAIIFRGKSCGTLNASAFGDSVAFDTRQLRSNQCSFSSLACPSAAGVELRDRLSACTSLGRRRTWFVFTPFQKGFNDVIAAGERVRRALQRASVAYAVGRRV